MIDKQKHGRKYSGQSYIELQTMRHVEHKTSIYMEFKTLRNDGQLLYIEQEGSETGRDFLSLAVVNGFVEFRYNLGSGPAVLRSLKKVIPGMWHSVSVKRWHQDSVLVLDSDPEVLGSVHGDLKSLDLSSSTYIGYTPPTLEQAAFNIGTTKGLIGCMRKIKLGHRTIRFHFDHEPVFKSAFQISECSDKLCQDVTCYNQVIFPGNNTTNYTLLQAVLCVIRPVIQSTLYGIFQCKSNQIEYWCN